MNRLTAALAAMAVLGLIPGLAQADAMVERGAYLANIMDCGGCHNTGAFTPEPNLATPLSGSDIGFEMPGMGIFYPPNLTPDKATGLGDWTEEQIIAAFTRGERPDGRILAPVMPWISYGHITPEDAKALTAYLRSLAPVDHKVPGPFGLEEKATAAYFTVKLPE